MTPTRHPGQHTEVELTRMQLDAVRSWHEARRVAERAAQVRTASREARMDLARRMEVLREQHRAIVARTEDQLEDSVHVLARTVHSRAVIVHRNAWFAEKVGAELEARGIEVVGTLENGAHGVGLTVAEQPDVLLVEDTLPMLPGEEVVREVCRFSPATLVVGHVAHEDRVAAMLDAGARAAFTRRVPPGDVAREVVALLRAGDVARV